MTRPDSAETGAGLVLDDQIPPGTLEGYLSAAAAEGGRVIRRDDGDAWTDYFEPGMLVRFPKFVDTPVSGQEIDQVLRATRKVLLNYQRLPDESHAANAYLYLCSDREYQLDKLSSNMRRDARRGLRELQVGPISLAQVRQHGLPVFMESRARHGLADGTAATFDEFLRPATTRPGRAYFGAWSGQRLAAFLDVTQLDDWAEIEGSYSLDEFRRVTPNDALIYFALEYYLRRRQARLVSIGVSSIESTGKEASLHRFKLKAGFAAVPVHRAFVVHPWIRPLANRGTLAALRLAGRLRPGERRLRKATAVLESLLGKTPPLEIEGPGDD